MQKRTHLVALMLICAALLTALAVLVPAPQTAQAQALTGFNWQGFYWNNSNFSGSYTASRIDATVNFNWGTSQPIAGIGPNNFSVRWYNTIAFEAGTYRFRAGADDGIRVAINNQIIIDRFSTVDSFTVNTADVSLQAGNYQIIVDYFNGPSGPAGVLFDWLPITPGQPVGPGGTLPPGVTPTPVFTATPVPVLKVVIIVDRANIRSGPGVNFPVIALATRDQIFKPLARNGDLGFETWFLVDLGGGARGWVARSVAYPYGALTSTLPKSTEVIDAPALQPTSASGQPAVGQFEVRAVTRNNALVRNAPSLYTGVQIGVIPAGATVELLKLSTNQAWAKVRYQELEGWTYTPNLRVTVGRYGLLPRGND